MIKEIIKETVKLVITVSITLWILKFFGLGT